MNQSIPEIVKLRLLLDLVSEARSQLQAGQQPRLRGFLRKRGLTPPEIEGLVEEWILLIKEIMQENRPRPLPSPNAQKACKTAASACSSPAL